MVSFGARRESTRHIGRSDEPIVGRSGPANLLKIARPATPRDRALVRIQGRPLTTGKPGTRVAIWGYSRLQPFTKRRRHDVAGPGTAGLSRGFRAGRHPSVAVEQVPLSTVNDWGKDKRAAKAGSECRRSSDEA